MVAFSIGRLRGASRNIPVDVFVKLGPDHFVHVFSQTSGIDYHRLAQYIAKGVEELYVKPEDHALLESFLDISTEMILSDVKSTREQKVGAILNLTEQNIAEIFQMIPISEKVAKSTERVIKSYLNVITNQADTLGLILKLASHGNYLYFHTIAVSVFSMLIAKEMLELGDPRVTPEIVELVGKGAFWHDIGLTTDIHSGSGASFLDEDSQPGHPRVGLNLLQNTPGVPEEIRFIVYQHHEQPSGRGYPNGLTQRAIYFPSQIVSVADHFSKEMSERSHKGKPAAAPEILEEMLKAARVDGKYDLSIVQAARMVFLVDGRKNKKPQGQAA